MNSDKRRKTRGSAGKIREPAYKEPPKAGASEIPFVTLKPPNAFGHMDELAIWLSALDNTHAQVLASPPAEIGSVERVLAAAALDGVIRALALRAPSELLRLLSKALHDVDQYGHPAMFHSDSPPQKRPPDFIIVQQIKGVLAGLTRVKQDEGMSRDAATSWTARNMAPELRRKLSNKPVTGRTVREWLDRYGGKYPPDSHGGKAFKVWSQPWGKQLTTAKFRELTYEWAKMIPSRTKKETR